MKKIFFAMVSAALLFAACSPMEPSKPALRAVPTPTFNDLSNLAITVNETSGWKVNIAADVDHLGVATWDLGEENGGVVQGNDLDLQIQKAGTHEFKLVKITNPTGVIEGEETFSFTTTEDLPFDFTPYIELLTSGTWIWDMVNKPTWGNGPPDSTAPSWAVGFPGYIGMADLTDDSMTFHADGSFTIVTGGEVLCNEGPTNEIAMWGPPAPSRDGADPASEIRPFEMPADAGWKWSLLPPASGSTKARLKLTGGAFPLYVPATDYVSNNEYEIYEHEEGKLYLRKMYGWGGWYMRFATAAE